MNDKQMLEQAIENAKEVVKDIEGQYKIKLREATKSAKEVIARLEEQHRELYGYKDSDLVYLVEVVRKSKEKGLTVREIGRKSSLFGLMTSDVTKDMLKALAGTGELLEVSIPPPSGRGRPRVAYIAKEYTNE